MAERSSSPPRASTFVAIDSKELLGDDPPPAVDPATGLPKEIRAFVVCKDPRMTVVPHFFSEQECEHLLSLAQRYWIPSLVGQATFSSEADYRDGNLENQLSTTRTSWSCMLRYSQTAVVERLEHRLASLAGLPVEQLERMNMVRYAPGELFGEHHDGKFRPKTVFVYLNDLPDDDEMGDTFFPILGLSFRPRRGTAVMWANAQGDIEDARMLHSGRPPTSHIKYGVNCFFNVKPMRQMTTIGKEIVLDNAAMVNIGDLGKDSGAYPASGEGEDRRIVAYRIFQDPKLVAIPDLLTETEAEEMLKFATSGKSSILPKADDTDPYRCGTQTLRVLAFEETPLVKIVENRLSSAAGLGHRFLGTLRIVNVGTELGFCNRGCGPKAAYVCLSERDEVLFGTLGLRLVLRRGDALMWPNVNWDTGDPVEDVRTSRIHLPRPDGTLAIGIDGFFHDNPVREQQGQREFVLDSCLAALAAVVR